MDTINLSCHHCKKIISISDNFSICCRCEKKYCTVCVPIHKRIEKTKIYIKEITKIMECAYCTNDPDLIEISTENKYDYLLRKYNLDDENVKEIMYALERGYSVNGLIKDKFTIEDKYNFLLRKYGLNDAVVIHHAESTIAYDNGLHYKNN